MSSVPTFRKAPGVPDVFDGKIYEQVGKYARGAVLYAFEQVGGPQGLAEWAGANPHDFYTKLFPKIITRETEVHHTRSVDDLMDVIDADYVSEVPPADEPPAPGERRFESFAPMDDEVYDDLPTGDDWDFDDAVEFDE